jgi:hypothetical protein
MRIANAADGYYKYLYDSNVAEFLQVGLISFIDRLIKLHNKKAIWFPCFQQSFALPRDYWQSGRQDTEILYRKIISELYIPDSGPSSNMPLFDISTAELKYEGYSDIEIEHIATNDERLNHFNKENNMHMARLIIDIIRSDNFTPKEIKMEDYFFHLDLDAVRRIR